MLALPPANGWNNLLKQNPGEWGQPKEGKAEGVNAKGSPQISWVTKTIRGASGWGRAETLVFFLDRKN